MDLTTRLQSLRRMKQDVEAAGGADDPALADLEDVLDMVDWDKYQGLEWSPPRPEPTG
jgi:hypothetical protein